MYPRQFSGVLAAVITLLSATHILAADQAVEAEVRTWTSSDGKYTTQASLVEIRNGQAVLKKKSGLEVKVPLDRLSDVDRQYISNLFSLESHKRDSAAAAKTTTPTEGTISTAEQDLADVIRPQRLLSFEKISVLAKHAAPIRAIALGSLSPWTTAAASKCGRPCFRKPSQVFKTMFKMWRHFARRLMAEPSRTGIPTERLPFGVCRKGRR